MKKLFVQTQNSKRLLAGFDQIAQRGAGEACLMAVDGEPGLGKTETVQWWAVQWWAVQSGAVYLRMKSKTTPTWLLRELLTELRVTPQHSFERMYAQASATLGWWIASA